MKQDPDEPKMRFHVAKLSLSNVRFLNKVGQEIDAAPDSEVARLYKSTMVASGHRTTNLPQPINQSVFQSMAYICLVWLRESFSKEQLEQIHEQFSKGDFSNVEICGQRKLDEPKHFLRLMRNAISHANVTYKDNQVKMWDQNTRTEKKYTRISMQWETLGQVCEKMIFATSKVLYESHSDC